MVLVCLIRGFAPLFNVSAVDSFTAEKRKIFPPSIRRKYLSFSYNNDVARVCVQALDTSFEFGVRPVSRDGESLRT